MLEPSIQHVIRYLIIRGSVGSSGCTPLQSCTAQGSMKA